MSDAPREPSPPPGSSLAWIAAAVGGAAVAMVAISRVLLPSAPQVFRGPSLEQVVAVAGDVRLATARPEGGFAHGEPGSPAETATRTRLEALATDLRFALGREPDVDALRTLGVTWFLLGRFDDASRVLETALGHAPGDAGLLTDLSAVDVERGLRGDDDALRRGLERARAALDADPARRAAAWNAALATTALDPDAAHDAWQRVLSIETDPGWIAEARRRDASPDAIR